MISTRMAQSIARAQANQERFRQACEKGKWCLSKKKASAYWLKQVKIVMSGPGKYWGDTKYEWPRDKATIYAIMAICIDERSAIKIIPDSLQKTESYAANKTVRYWVMRHDLSTEFMNYIEEDLQSKSLLDSVAKVTGQKPVAEAVESKWSKPMTKTKIMNKLGLDGPRSLDTFTKEHPIRNVANNRQLWQICLDGLPANLREKFK